MGATTITAGTLQLTSIGAVLGDTAISVAAIANPNAAVLAIQPGLAGATTSGAVTTTIGSAAASVTLTSGTNGSTNIAASLNMVDNIASTLQINGAMSIGAGAGTIQPTLNFDIDDNGTTSTVDTINCLWNHHRGCERRDR